jgi:hypothetical protein
MVCINCAKSFLGKHVNVHLTSGDAIVNVVPIKITESNCLDILYFRNHSPIPLKHIHHMDTLSEVLLTN